MRVELISYFFDYTDTPKNLSLDGLLVAYL